MNTKTVNSAAGVILAALTQNRTAAGIALALDSAQLLMSPDTPAELNRLGDRVLELEQMLAEKDRPVDEDPIAFVLTEQAGEHCDHPNGHGPHGCAGCGAFASADDEDDVRPQVRKLRALLAGQREQVGGKS